VKLDAAFCSESPKSTKHHVTTQGQASNMLLERGRVSHLLRQYSVLSQLWWLVKRPQGPYRHAISISIASALHPFRGRAPSHLTAWRTLTFWPAFRGRSIDRCGRCTNGSDINGVIMFQGWLSSDSISQRNCPQTHKPPYPGHPVRHCCGRIGRVRLA
jgi:hypothetical protein